MTIHYGNVVKVEGSLKGFQPAAEKKFDLKFSLISLTYLLFCAFFLYVHVFHSHHHAACWLVLIGYLLDLADGAVARQLNACSALGE